MNRMIRTSDGVDLAVTDIDIDNANGGAGAPPLVFLHGIAQSRASFATLFDGDDGSLAATHRLVAFDYRGHGDSGKPSDPAAYTGERLGGDLHAVMEGLGLERPIVVAWSYGGVVLGEYLRVYGDGALGGMLLVAAAMLVGKPAGALFGPTMMANVRGIMAPDDAVYEPAARAFVKGCVASSNAAVDAILDRAHVAMLRVPAVARRALLLHSGDYTAELARCTAPLATVHGAADSVVLPRMSEIVASVAPSTQSTPLAGVGHLPWVEATEPFLAALRALTARVDARRALC